MLFISLIGVGIGVLAALALGTAAFVSAAFCSEARERVATDAIGADSEVSDSCVLQVIRDPHGCPVVTSTRQLHARPARSTRP